MNIWIELALCELMEGHSSLAGSDGLSTLVKSRLMECVVVRITMATVCCVW